MGLSSYYRSLQGTVALALVGGSATLYLGLLNYWLQRDRLLQDLFISFNKRYDDLNDHLLIIASGGEPKDKGTERVVVDYLNLCAEEYFWYRRGRIDMEIWQEWHNGIKHWIKVPVIRAIVLKEASVADSYYGLFALLEIQEE
ncbi:MAG: hypothetical protein ABI432_15745 [Flavobacteriales bacterium]